MAGRRTLTRLSDLDDSVGSASARAATDALFPGSAVLPAVAILRVSSAQDFAVRVAAGKWIHLRRGNSPKDYGALFDGATDDAAAFALAGAEVHATSDGTYLSYNTLEIPVGVSVLGNLVDLQNVGVIRGQGRSHGSAVRLAAGVNKPLFHSPIGQPNVAMAMMELQAQAQYSHIVGADVRTTGSITSGTAALTVTVVTGMVVGGFIRVYGAGVGGKALTSRIVSIVGSVVTLADNASTTVVAGTAGTGNVRPPGTVQAGSFALLDYTGYAQSEISRVLIRDAPDVGVMFDWQASGSRIWDLYVVGALGHGIRATGGSIQNLLAVGLDIANTMGAGFRYEGKLALAPAYPTSGQMVGAVFVGSLLERCRQHGLWFDQMCGSLIAGSYINNIGTGEQITGAGAVTGGLNAVTLDTVTGWLVGEPISLTLRGAAGATHYALVTAVDTATGKTVTFTPNAASSGATTVARDLKGLAHGGVYLDEDSAGNVVLSQALVNAKIIDVGWNNYRFGNDGEYWPFTEPIERYFGSSLAPDPDESMASAAFWTASGATLTKVSFSQTTILRSIRRRGRLPTIITSTSADVHHAYKKVDVLEGETFLVEAFVKSNNSAVARSVRIRILNDADGSELFKGEAFALNVDVGNTERRYQTVWYNPAGSGVTRARVAVQPIGAYGVDISYLNVVRLAVPNSGFDGSYAAGIAPAWVALSSNVGGTPAEETTIVRSGDTAAGFSKAQKITVAAGERFQLKPATTWLPDAWGGLYLWRPWAYVASGDPTQVVAGHGSGTNGLIDALPQVLGRGLVLGKWMALDSVVMRPNSTHQPIVGVIATAGVATVAYFDDCCMIPLKDGIGPRTTISDRIDLATPKTQVLAAPSIDSRLRRLKVVVCENTTAGCLVRVGTAADPTKYGSWTSAVKAVGDEVTITLSTTFTDIRSGTPVLIQPSATATGVVQVVAEWE